MDNKILVIFCFCEAFLYSQFSDNKLNIPNYNLYVKTDMVVALYTRSNLAWLHRDDLERTDAQIAGNEK